MNSVDNAGRALERAHVAKQVQGRALDNLQGCLDLPHGVFAAVVRRVHHDTVYGLPALSGQIDDEFRALAREYRDVPVASYRGHLERRLRNASSGRDDRGIFNKFRRRIRDMSAGARFTDLDWVKWSETWE